MNKKLDKTLKVLCDSFNAYIKIPNEQNKSACWKSIFNIIGVIDEYTEANNLHDDKVVSAKNSIRELEKAFDEDNVETMISLIEAIEKTVRTIE